MRKPANLSRLEQAAARRYARREHEIERYVAAEAKAAIEEFLDQPHLRAHLEALEADPSLIDVSDLDLDPDDELAEVEVFLRERRQALRGAAYAIQEAGGAG
jgi:hypothetical protein